MKKSIDKQTRELSKSLLDAAKRIPKGARGDVVKEIKSLTNLGETQIGTYLHGGVAKIHTGLTILNALNAVLADNEVSIVNQTPIKPQAKTHAA